MALTFLPRCATCAARVRCYKLMNGNSDDNFHCEACWRAFGGVPHGSVVLPPTGCESCAATGQTVYMLDPYNESSTITWHCVDCWKSFGGVPDKALMWPWAAGPTFPLEHTPSTMLSTVFVTDFGFPQPHMAPVFHVFEHRKIALQHQGAHVINHVDATDAEAIRRDIGEPWLVIWGSPHPNTFNELFAKHLLDGLGGTYKAAAMDYMKASYPGSNVVMPHPSCYELPGATRMAVPTVRGVRYTPMASSKDALQRLCPPSKVMVVASGPDVDGCLDESGVFDLRGLVQRGIAKGKLIIFFGEYICELSYTCCLDNGS